MRLAMGTVARGRPEERERARSAAAIPAVVWRRIALRLDEYIQDRIKLTEERLKRGKKRLKREHALPQRGVRSPDRALRTAIGDAVARFRAAPVVPEGLYLDPDDARPVPSETVRDTAKILAA